MLHLPGISNTKTDQDSVIDVLDDLRKQGKCVLGPQITPFSPYQKKGCVPNLKSWQQRYVRHNGQAEAVTVDKPVKLGILQPERAAAAAAAPPDGTCNNDNIPQPQNPTCLYAELEILQVPAAATLPIIKGHRFEIPFKVRLTCVSFSSERQEIEMEAFLLDENAVAQLEHWVPPTTNDAVGNARKVKDLEFAKISQDNSVVVVGNDDQQAYGGVVDFEFHKLVFNQPSQVRPRWLVFVTRMQGSSLFVQFLVPTIIMSRRSEQEEKALRLLWGKALTKPTQPTAQGIERFIKTELESLGIQREISPLDCLAIAKRAGLMGIMDGQQASSTLQATLGGLQQYMEKTKSLLKVIKPQFDRTMPTLVCDFSITRSAAEAMLLRKPVGTFTLRFAQEAGVLAMSVVCQKGLVQHHRFTTEKLVSGSLFGVLSSFMTLGHQVMDSTTQELYPCDVLFNTSGVTLKRQAEQQHQPLKRSCFGHRKGAASAVLGLYSAHSYQDQARRSQEWQVVPDGPPDNNGTNRSASCSEYSAAAGGGPQLSSLDTDFYQAENVSVNPPPATTSSLGGELSSAATPKTSGLQQFAPYFGSISQDRKFPAPPPVPQVALLPTQGMPDLSSSLNVQTSPTLAAYHHHQVHHLQQQQQQQEQQRHPTMPGMTTDQYPLNQYSWITNQQSAPKRVQSCNPMPHNYLNGFQHGMALGLPANIGLAPAYSAPHQFGGLMFVPPMMNPILPVVAAPSRQRESIMTHSPSATAALFNDDGLSVYQLALDI